MDDQGFTAEELDLASWLIDMETEELEKTAANVLTVSYRFLKSNLVRFNWFFDW